MKNNMFFTLGFFTGLLFCVLLFLIESNLAPSERPITRLKQFLPSPKGIVFTQTEEQREFENAVEGLDKEGKDVKLDEIL